MALCWVNGELLPPEQATVSVFDHGLLYGDGVFEGIRFYQGQAFRLVEHLARLQRSAKALRLQLPYSIEELTHAVHVTIQAYNEPDGYIRLVITRGVGRLTLDADTCKQGTVFIIADSLDYVAENIRQQGARVIIASTRRLPVDGLDPRIKSLNYLNHVLARMEATHIGADEAILLNRNGFVTEGSADNVFIVKDDTLFTPPISDGALEGITRELILELAPKHGIKAKECSLAPYDLYTADECFLTGTATELIPVRDVDGRQLTACPGPVFKKLNLAFQQVIRDECHCKHVDILNQTGKIA